MSRIRDIANLFSANTDAATDAEVTAAIAAHNNATTSVHGISNTAVLATQTYVQNNKGVNSGNTASRPGSPSNGDVYSNTQTGFLEVYSSTYGWEQIGGIASTVTGVTATNSGSGRAYNNGSASIAFTPGTIVGRTYTVTSSPGSYTASGSSSPITITGLQSSTQYTYTIVASNNYGTSSASSASTGVTATTVPQAPTIDSVASSNGDSAIITFTAGATGGSAITSYSITSTPSTTTQTTSSSPYTFTGLTLDQSYTFTMTATNANGTSASTTSSSVTIEQPDSGAMFPIGIVQLSGTTSYIEFTSIPQTYKHLQLRFLTATTDGYTDGYIAFNGDTTSTNYYANRIFGNGNATGNTAQNTNYNFNGWGSGETNLFVAGITDILDYSDSTKRKVSRTFTGFANNIGASTNNWIGQHSLTWDNTNAITSLRIYYVGSNLFANSQATLYGIKGA